MRSGFSGLGIGGYVVGVSEMGYWGGGLEEWGMAMRTMRT